jgi:hypothetical protein
MGVRVTKGMGSISRSFNCSMQDRVSAAGRAFTKNICLQAKRCQPPRARPTPLIFLRVNAVPGVNDVLTRFDAGLVLACQPCTERLIPDFYNGVLDRSTRPLSSLNRTFQDKPALSTGLVFGRLA